MAGDLQNDDLRWLEQVASLGDAQQPLVAGLKVLADDLREGTLKKRLTLFAKRLDAGVPLEKALEVSDDFPSYVRSAILIGLKTGRLGSVIEEIAWQQQANRSALRSVWAALAYPLMVLGLLVLVVQLLFVWLVPMFVGFYHNFDLELPVLTLFIMSVARSGVPWFSMAGILIILLLCGLRIGSPSWFPTHWLNRLPLLGPLWSWVSFAEFTRLLAILVRHGVPLPEALRVTADGVHDRWIATGCRAIADDVESGRPLAAAIARKRFFPASLTALIDWGQTTGGLASSLEMAGDIYADRVELQAAFVKAVLPPMLLVVILLIASLSIFGLMVPLVDLIQGLT